VVIEAFLLSASENKTLEAVMGLDFIEVFRHFFERLAEYPAIKLVAGFFIWLFSAMYGKFNPVYSAIIAFIIADWLSAIWFAWVDPNSKIESSRMKEGAVKLLIYAVALSAGHFCSFVAVVAPLEAYIQGYILVTELISLCENAKKLADHYRIQIPVLDTVIGFLHGKQKALNGGVDDDQT
jgi:phage-related holin